MNIEFTKMHGLGNDFVVVDNMNGRIKLTSEQVVFLRDRHKGIGADGVILVEPSDEADCFMNYINADGTLAEMCGNGVRCTTQFFRGSYAPKKTNFKIATRSGIKEIKVHDDQTYSVNMGQASFRLKDFEGEQADLEGFNLHLVSMGNPFAIAFVPDVTEYNLLILGPKIENNKNFPNRINFELVQENSPTEFSVRVWERGCGETLACGTGACAIYALLQKLKKTPGEINLDFPGGRLRMSGDEEGNIIMRGPAEKVFTAMIQAIN